MIDLDPLKTYSPAMELKSQAQAVGLDTCFTHMETATNLKQSADTLFMQQRERMTRDVRFLMNMTKTNEMLKVASLRKQASEEYDSGIDINESAAIFFSEFCDLMGKRQQLLEKDKQETLAVDDLKAYGKSVSEMMQSTSNLKDERLESGAMQILTKESDCVASTLLMTGKKISLSEKQKQTALKEFEKNNKDLSETIFKL